MTRTIAKLQYFIVAMAGVSLVASIGEARVTRIQITSREVVADGISFGDVGPYEKLIGTVYFAVDPNNPRNAVVFDLDKAPRNAKGFVEFSADMFILKPVDLKKGNGGLLFEVTNHGNKAFMWVMNDVLPGANGNNPTEAWHFGNGFLMRQGYTLAWVGWEAGIIPGMDRMTVQFPIAMQDGKPIAKLILAEFSDARGASEREVYTQSLGGNPTNRGYEAVSTDPAEAIAELRMRPSDSPRPPAPDIPAGEVIPKSQWSFARCPDGPPGTPSTTDICLADGFQNDKVYQLIYKAINPQVRGLGYVTTRDFVSFLHHATEDDAGHPNPIRGISTALCFGGSQDGNYLRDFLYQGFNEDEQEQPVFGGVFVHAAGVKKIFLNYRFAQSFKASDQHVTRHAPNETFPRTYAIREYPLTGRKDGILKRPATDPKVIHTDTATEYWQGRSSLVDTDEDGAVDLDQPDNVRRYLLSSFEHSGRKGATSDYGVGDRQCQQLSNATNHGGLMRALLVALDEWVRYGTEPPDSRVPRIDNGTLVPPDQYCREFPRIPGVTCNGLHNASGERDFGPGVEGNRGVIEPDYLIPPVLSVHRVLVPRADAIGNDIAGIRHPFVEAPVATLTGWNLRRPEFTDGDLCDIKGMMLPLPKTLAEALKTGDPRPSLEELYGDHTGYVLAVAKAALNLWAHRLMLLEDVFQTVQEADDRFF